MEIYLNGKLIGTAGKVGQNAKTEESIGYFDPVFFTFDEQENQHIAIRYSNHNYRKAWNKAPIGPIIFMGFEKAIENTFQNRRSELNQVVQLNILQIGFFLALAIIHLLLFIFYPSERANLIYGVMMLATLLGGYGVYMLNVTYIPEDFINYILLEGSFVILFSVLNIYFVYEIIKKKINWLPLVNLPLVSHMRSKIRSIL